MLCKLASFRSHCASSFISSFCNLFIIYFYTRVHLRYEHGSRNRCAALQCEHVMTARVHQKNGQLFNRGLQPLHLEVEWAVLKLASAPSVSDTSPTEQQLRRLTAICNRWKSLGKPLMTAGLGRPVSLQVPLTRKQAFCCSSDITRSCMMQLSCTAKLRYCCRPQKTLL